MVTCLRGNLIIALFSETVILLTTWLPHSTSRQSWQQWRRFSVTFVASVSMRIRPNTNSLLSSVSNLIVTGANRRWQCAGTPSRGNWNQCCTTLEMTPLSGSREFVPCLQILLLEGLSYAAHDEPGSAEGINVHMPTASRKETLGMPDYQSIRFTGKERHVGCTCIATCLGVCTDTMFGRHWQLVSFDNMTHECSCSIGC